MLSPGISAATLGELWVSADLTREELRRHGWTPAEGRRGSWQRVHGSQEAYQAWTEAQQPQLGWRPDHRLPASERSGYPSPEELEARLRSWAEEHADVELMRLGSSRQGRPIWGLRIGQPGQPRWQILGGHHGDESISWYLALEAIQALLTGEGDWEGLRQQRELIWVPLVNPDGAAQGSRYNAAGVDLNRNYGFEWSRSEAYSGQGPFSEPETQALRALMLLSPSLGGLSLHSGAENIGYPWNWTESPAAEAGTMRGLARQYTLWTGLEHFWWTQGADWYITYGDSTDWSFGLLGTLDFTLELSSDKSPDPEELPGYLQAHLPAIAGLLSEPAELELRVLSAESGWPLAARIEMEEPSMTFFSDPSGAAWRTLGGAGPWTLRIEHPGFGEQTVELEPGVPAEIALTPSPAGEGLWDLSTEQGRLGLQWLRQPAPAEVTLWRAGVPPQRIPLEEGAGELSLEGLPSGGYSLAWELEGVSQGAASAVWLPPRDDLQVLEVRRSEAGLALQLDGWTEGARVWAVHREEGARLRLDAQQLPDRSVLVATQGHATQSWSGLAVWSQGEELFVPLDREADPAPFEDTAVPLDSQPPADRDSGAWDPGSDWDEPEACRCQSSSAGAWEAVLVLLLLLRRRTPRCSA